MTRPAHIKQPGAELAPRLVAVPTRGRSLRLTLAPGQRLLDAVAAGFAGHGFASGSVDIAGLALAPLAYVMPALSTTGAQAAYYSETYRPLGTTRVHRGTMTFGRRDGAPFFHAHALWTEPDGKQHGGHILPDDTLVSERTEVTAFGIADAQFQGDHDPETNFTLFGPVAVNSTVKHDAATAVGRAWAIRLRPNQDVATALETFCAANGVTRARIHGGVGSTIGAVFDDGHTVENFATEVFIRHGIVTPSADGSPAAKLDVGLVDYTGATAEGRLSRGQNPVLMTFELILEAII
jgi:predicted DNA-binding protein with PD1-like motif